VAHRAALTGLPALHEAADEGRLPAVLEVVGDHADQPHPKRDRRVPSLVHDAVQIGIGEAFHIPDGLLVDLVVVAHQQV
jgi:hypothetical protein